LEIQMHRFARSATLLPAALATSALAQSPADAGGKPVAATTSTAAWYLRNEVGGNLIPSISLRDKSITVGADTVSVSGAELSMDGGVGWNIAFGLRLSDSLALEVSSGLSYNQFDSVSGTIDVNGTSVSGTTGIDGHLLQVPILVGPRLELPLGEAFRLNVGASVGTIYLNGDLDSDINGVLLSGSDTSWAFAYSATLGLEWAMAPNFGLGVAYRFLGTTSASFGEGNLIEAGGIYNQQVLATLTIRF
jgi:opacity protein-like surface antigen